MDSNDKEMLNGDGSHIEDGSDTKRSTEGGLKLDPHGLPLLPQPSRFKDDPLVSASTA